MMTYSIDIAGEVENGAEAYRHVILGTHAFDSEFFEFGMLPMLQSKDTDSILVVSDADAYQSEFSRMQRAGIEYDMDYCHVPAEFNARFALMTWQDGARLVISGSDITAHEMAHPGTMAGCVTYAVRPRAASDANDDDNNNQAAKILADFGLFVSGMLSKKHIRDKKSRTTLADACEALPKSDADQMFDLNLLHNLEKPILHQLPRYIDEPVESAKILTGAGCDSAVLESLASIGCCNFEVYAPPGYGICTPTGDVTVPSEIEDVIAGATVRMIATGSSSSGIGGQATPGKRTIILNTATRSFCLYGGADPTRHGLLGTSKDGNVELCMLAKSRERCKYDELVKSKSTSCGHAGSFIRLPRTWEGTPGTGLTNQQDDAIQALVTGAHLGADGKKLYIQTDTLVESGTVTLRHPGSPDTASVQFDSKYKSLILELDDKCSSFCAARINGPTYVQVSGSSSVEDGQDGAKVVRRIRTNPRWLSVPPPVPKPSKADADLARRTRCRSGLIPLLYKLDKFAGVDDTAWFCRFGTRMTSKNLESIDVQRLYTVRKKFCADDAWYGPPPDSRTVNAIFESKFERTTSMTHRYMHERYSPRRFDAAFDHFVMWSKVILWLVAEKHLTLGSLRFIRMSIEEFLIMHRKNTADKKIRMHLNRLHFWEHALWLLYVVLSHQKKAGYFSHNTGVARVFKGDVDMIFDQSGKKRFSKTAFEQIIREYAEFRQGPVAMDITVLSEFYASEFLKKLF